MATVITRAGVDTLNNASNLTTYTGSCSATDAGTLLLWFVSTSHGSAAVAPTSITIGDGTYHSTFVNVGGTAYSSNLRHISAWVAVGLRRIPAATSYTVTFAGQMTSCLVNANAFTYTKLSAASGQDAIAHILTGTGTGVTSGTALTLNDPGSQSATIYCISTTVNAAITPGTNYTELQDVGHSEPARMETAWRADNTDLTAGDASWTGAADYGLIAIALAANPLESGPIPFVNDSRTQVTIGFRTHAAATDTDVNYSTSSDLSSPTNVDGPATAAGADFTAGIALTGLTPGTVYYYDVLVDGVSCANINGNYPSFRAPRAAADTTSFTMVTTECHGNDGTGGPADIADGFYAIGSLATVPELYLQGGDMTYGNPTTLATCRTMWQNQRGNASGMGGSFKIHMVRNRLMSKMWDDHDEGMNNGDYTDANRGNAIQAFKEYNYTTHAGSVDGVYHKFSYGFVDFIILDGRTSASPNSQTDDSLKSMLGSSTQNPAAPDTGQLAWLKTAITNSAATWIVIYSSRCWNPTTTKPGGDKAWGQGFSTERADIMSHINASGKKPRIIFISGDIHSGGGADTGANSGTREFNIPHFSMEAGSAGADTVTDVGLWSQGILSGGTDGGAKGDYSGDGLLSGQFAVFTFTTSSVTMDVRSNLTGALLKRYAMGRAHTRDLPRRRRRKPK